MKNLTSVPVFQRMKFLAIFMAIALSIVLVGRPLSAQDLIEDAVECPDCEIRVEPVVRLGMDGDESFIPRAPSSVLLDSRGRFWVFFGLNEPPMVFTADGRFLQRAGRAGRGPGEFLDARVGLRAGDSIAVYDQGAGRLTVLGPDLSLLRSVRLVDPKPDDLLAIDWPVSVAVAGVGRGSDIVAWPVHILDLSQEDAHVRHSMGTHDGTLRPGSMRFDMVRRLAQGVGDSFWAANRYASYQIVRWNAEGDALQHLVRVADWFPEDADRLMGSREEPPKPAIVGVLQNLQSESGSRLTAILQIPDSDWKAAWSDKPELPPGRASVPASWVPRDTELYDTRIEILAIEQRAVVARRDLPGFPVDVLPDGRLVMYHETPVGLPYLEIVRVLLPGS